MFKYNSGQEPYRLNQLFKPNHMVHSYETRNRNNCYIPYRSSRLGQYSLSFQGPRIWSSIDNKTKDTKSVFFLLKSVLTKNFFLSRTMTVVAKNSPIDLFTDTAAILNSIVSNSYYGMLSGQISMYLPPEHPIIDI